ncbi:MAG: alpha/beta hydrolase [Acidobacteria bacterium]|nr:alpha/beta hydrolase [Acidobacteriota bacterium]
MTSWFVSSGATQANTKVHADIVYATVGGTQLALDLYLPAGVEHPPLIVWVHGGRWVLGDKSEVPMIFVAQGIATASLDFRQSDEARFPAMVHDIKAAIRFLRAKASEYGYRADRVAIGGTSSGAHLAALVGTTNGHPTLEGTAGDYPDRSSDVHAIVSYYGAFNLATILAQSTPEGLGVRVPSLEGLLGALPDQAPELARLASPVAHVNQSAPPLLLLHGDQDQQTPIDQSYELERAYALRGLDVHLEVLHGAAHGGESDFFSEERNAQVVAFLRRTVG